MVSLQLLCLPRISNSDRPSPHHKACSETFTTTTTFPPTIATAVAVTPTTVAPEAEVLPAPEASVLGIQTELLVTGFGNKDSTLLALALAMAGGCPVTTKTNRRNE
jgi:hypothetical protein